MSDVICIVLGLVLFGLLVWGLYLREEDRKQTIRDFYKYGKPTPEQERAFWRKMEP